MALETTLEFVLRWVNTSVLDLSTIRDSSNVSGSDTLTSGTGLDQADRIFHDRRSLAATTEELDLAGSLTDVFGAALTFVKVKGIWIKNNNTTAAQTLTVGGAASNAFLLFADATDKMAIGPNSQLFRWEPSLAGIPVTAGTGDKLKFDAGAVTISYDIVIIGTSA